MTQEEILAEAQAEDVHFLRSMGITLDEPEPLPDVPVVATAFYAAFFTLCFYLAMLAVCLL